MGLGGKKKNRRNSTAWVGKYRILVKSFTYGVRSELFVVDLKQNIIVMNHPQPVWSNDYFNSTAVLHKGTLSVLNIGVDNFGSDGPRRSRFHRRPSSPTKIPVNEEQDYIHSSESNTCTSTLDLTVTPPVWSNWTPAPKMIYKWNSPFCAALHNNITAFHHTKFNSTNPQVYQFRGRGGNDDKWEKITIPYGGRLTPKYPGWLTIEPISDPNNNRIIAYFCNNENDYLYAYYPNRDNNKWKLLHQHVSERHVFMASTVADQVVADNLILCLKRREQQIFMAYNIFTNKWLDVVVVDGLFKYDDPHKNYFCISCKLIYLGNGILCLATDYQGHKNVIEFLRFSVKCVEEEEERVHLTPLSFHTISIDNIDCIVDTFIPF